MNGVLVEPVRWTPWRWGIVLASVFGLQLALIFLLGDRSLVKPRPPAVAPSLQLTGRASAELMALMDPTLFALPHRQGFSGRAWFALPAQALTPFVWFEPPSWLPLAADQLGISLRGSADTNASRFELTSARAEPALTLPAVTETETMTPSVSTLRLAGGLVGRRLRTPPALPSWTNSDLLTHTVIRTLVDADGRTVSVMLVRPGCGRTEADQYALQQARKLRFEPLKASTPETTTSPLAGLTWGELFFEWRTLPMP